MASRLMNVVKIVICTGLFLAIVQFVKVYHFTTKYKSQIGELRHSRMVSDINDYIEFSKMEQGDQAGGEIATTVAASNHAESVETPPPAAEEQEKVECTIKNNNALSALKRVKTEKCRKEIYRTSCLNEAGTLYWQNITRFCPLDRTKGTRSHPVEAKAPYGPPIRILYAIVIHGRAFRQVKRLFKSVFHVNHYFYFHVDSRSNYLYREVVEFTSEFNNVVVTPWRMATIWGGASLLKMLLRMMEDVLAMKDWKWDFFINLSACDYPVQTDEKLTAFLRSHRDENFLSNDGSSEKFAEKQKKKEEKKAKSWTFLECEEHMWRLGERQLPKKIDFIKGSDWICLNRKFVDYMVNSRDTLVLGLRQLYAYSLLPAESYFHTVLSNSAYCETYAKGNLRLINWKRERGCDCNQYRHIVDACGCSPNDFKPEYLSRLRLQSQTINYFARKFEPIVSQEVVNSLDEWLYGKLPSTLPGLHSYWENAYHYRDDRDEKFDVYMTFYQSFARITSQLLTSKSECRYTSIWKVKEATYFIKNDIPEGILVIYEAKVATDDVNREFLRLETHFKPIPSVQLFVRNMSAPVNRLNGLEIGTSWDRKEYIFRNIGGLIGPRDDPMLVQRWGRGEELSVRIIWQDPLNVVASMYEMKIEKSMRVISHNQPTFTKPLRPGTWTVKLVYNDDVVIGSIKFLVVPQAYFGGKPASFENVVATNNGPAAGLYEFDREANDTDERVKDLSENSLKTGAQLDTWVDKNVLQHWRHVDACALLDSRDVFQKCGGALPSCHKTTWSSRSPDPKSEFGLVTNGRLR